MKNYNEVPKILAAVDCIIFGFDNDELKLLLIKRDFEPERNKWSLMGGFIDENEHADDAAKRVLKELTGLQNIFMEKVEIFTAPDRDPVDRVISIAYFALINITEDMHPLSATYSAQWFSLKDLPELVFDHKEMVGSAITKLRQRTSVRPIGFELLPEKFTMKQLQKLYEAILNEKIDKRNFTKKINMMNILVKLDEKDKSSSKKGSFLYQFDSKKYERRLQNGMDFKL